MDNTLTYRGQRSHISRPILSFSLWTELSHITDKPLTYRGQASHISRTSLPHIEDNSLTDCGRRSYALWTMFSHVIFLSMYISYISRLSDFCKQAYKQDVINKKITRMINIFIGRGGVSPPAKSAQNNREAKRLPYGHSFYL